VLKYDGTTGAFIGVFASGNGISAPLDVKFGADGNLYVSDCFGGQSISKFDGTTGAGLGTFGGGLLVNPTGLAFGSDGLLYVGSLGDNRIQKFALNGSFQGTYISGNGLNLPDYIAFAPNSPSVPEPRSLSLLGIGALGLVGGVSRARRKA